MGERTEQVITLSLPNSMQHVYLLRLVITEILKGTDFDANVQEQINLAVIEAGNSQIQSGERKGFGERTTFQLILTEGGFTVNTVGVNKPLEPEAALRREDRAGENVIMVSIPSAMQHVYLLDVIVTEVLKEMDFDEDIREQINLAAIEAGTNAIKHGNREDPRKKATIQFILDDDKLTIVIEDEGQGFARTEVADPLEPANLLKSSGRGLFLMETCMDSVTYESDGTIIRMVKYKK